MMMYGLITHTFARSVSSSIVSRCQSFRKHQKTCLMVLCSQLQVANRNFYHSPRPYRQTLLSKYEKRCESCNIRNCSDSGLDAVKQELDGMRTIGKNVPETISDPDLEYYASLTSKSGKKKFLNFLFKREGLRKQEKLKKLQKKAEREETFEGEDTEVGLPVNRILRRISAVTMLAGDNWRVASGMKFSPQIAFDFSFDKYMARPEIISMVSQLTHVLNANKAAREPFHMHWTGLQDGNSTLKEMKRMFGHHTFENLMVSITNQDVIDVFPRDKLIYLTADSNNIMHTFDVDKVYVIGGLVDARTIQTGVTLAKAKRYNISHARFPLDLYLQWEMGAKTLTLDQVARILHTMHETQDWIAALQNVPIRKHSGFKVSHQASHNVMEKIPTRPELEKYYQKQKEAINKGRERKQTVARDNSRFSFSRAKREFKWDLLESETTQIRSYKTKEINWDEEHDEEFDPTNDTLFSSFEKTEKNHMIKERKRGPKWFQE